jgi:hypothetical protein
VFGIEDTGSYGAGLASFLRRTGDQVVEVNRGARSVRHLRGKDDTIDAETAARSVLSGTAARDLITLVFYGLRDQHLRCLPPPTHHGSDLPQPARGGGGLGPRLLGEFGDHIKPFPLASARVDEVNAAHARRRGPGERVNAEMKNWRILRKIRSSPNRASELVAAFQTLMIANA